MGIVDTGDCDRTLPLADELEVVELNADVRRRTGRGCRDGLLDGCGMMVVRLKGTRINLERISTDLGSQPQI